MKKRLRKKLAKCSECKGKVRINLKGSYIKDGKKLICSFCFGETDYI